MLKDDKKTVISVKAYSAELKEITMEKSTSLDSRRDILENAGRFAVEIVESFSGVLLGFGTVQLKNTGSSGDYSVYVDRIHMAENVEEMRVLAGDRIIEVRQHTQSGDEKLLEIKRIAIEENRIYQIAFETLPPENLEKLEEQAEEKKKELNKMQASKAQVEPANVKIYKDYSGGQALEFAAGPGVGLLGGTKFGVNAFTAYMWEVNKDTWIGPGAGIMIGFPFGRPALSKLSSSGISLWEVSTTIAVLGGGKLVFGDKTEGFAFGGSVYLGWDFLSYPSEYDVLFDIDSFFTFRGSIDFYYTNFFLEIGASLSYGGDATVDLSIGYSIPTVEGGYQ